MEIFSMGGRRKSKHKLGGMKVCQANEVREYFINPETENEASGWCANLVWISENFMLH